MGRRCPLIHIANLDKEVDIESIVFANREELQRGYSRPRVAELQDLLVVGGCTLPRNWSFGLA
jgi:hypothetical protein